MYSDEGAAPWATDVEALWTRVTGGRFAVEVYALAPGTGRSFEARSRSGRLLVGATDAGAACVGIHTFLRRHCGIAIMWDTVLPLTLTDLPDSEILRGSARVPQFYYLNFCTFSYSTAYWGWPEWEREIDWMALHGVTMPLAVVGHEATLRLAYGRMGMADAEIREFLGGPGYLPFVYMGCLDSFAGPLPESWIEEHLELGRRILERERSLGMTPVLPAFTGHIPRALAPADARVRHWQGMPTTVVPPDDPLFVGATVEIATAQRELFGTDHLYASDPFIEMSPAETDASADYPAAVAKAIVRGLAAADEDAVWVLQSWPFAYQPGYWTTERVRDFLAGVPTRRLLVLDLWGEAHPQWARIEGFFGKRWVWNALLNFGGRSEPVADLGSAVGEMASALGSARPPIGVGLTMEAIHTNPIFFELVADGAWSQEAESLHDWVRTFARERYGVRQSALIESTWADLAATVYNGRSTQIFPEFFISIAVSTPSFEALLAPDSTVHDDIRAAVYFDPTVLLRAWKTLASVAHERPDLLAGPLGADLVQAGTAALLRILDARFGTLLVGAIDSGHVSRAAAQSFLAVFDDLEQLAATRPSSRFGSWEDSAAAWGRDPASIAILRDNARRIVTVWGTARDGRLDNYSARLWSGLVSAYYKKRWMRWCDLLPRALEARAEVEDVLASELEDLAESFLTTGAPPASLRAPVLVDLTDRLIGDYEQELGLLKISPGPHEGVAAHDQP